MKMSTVTMIIVDDCIGSLVLLQLQVAVVAVAVAVAVGRFSVFCTIAKSIQSLYVRLLIVRLKPSRQVK